MAIDKRIINRFYELYSRSKIEVKVQYADQSDNQISSRLSNVTKKVLYKYYNCDYCNARIVINGRRDGIVILPRTLTKRTPLKLALCNKCIGSVVKEFEEEYK